MKKYKISFCTSCTKRLHHIRETYLLNIELNLDYGEVEFVLLNWNSGDGLDEWVEKNLGDYINEGVVKYLHTKSPSEFDMARTKNVTARNASGEIVCWVDGDNFISEGYADYLNETFCENEDIILNNIVRITRKREGRPNWGRIALFKKYFMEVRGYDEAFNGWGWEERDFKNRIMRHCSLKDVKFMEEDCNYIKHESSFLRPRRTNIRNRGLAMENLAEKRYVVNEDIDFGDIDDLKIKGGRDW